MSRIARVLIVFSALWAAWVGVFLARKRGGHWLTQCLILLAGALHGAGIMLIAQIYHMQGNAADAVWLWAVVTLATATLTRASLTLTLAVILFGIWQGMEHSMFWDREVPGYGYLACLLVASVVAYWAHARLAAHAIAISLLYWFFDISVWQMDSNGPWAMSALYFGLLCLMGLLLFAEGAGRWLRGFEHAAVIYVLIALGAWSLFWYFGALNIFDEMLFVLVQARLTGIVALVVTLALAALAHVTANENRYDLMVLPVAVLLATLLQGWLHATPFLLELYLLAFTIWIIRMGWRVENGLISALGYLGFALVMLNVYFMTVGTLLGTSAFYLLVGFGLLASVFVVSRWRRGKEDDA